MVSCSSSGIFSTWANGFRPLNARFHRVAVFTDFTALRPGSAGTVITIDESLKGGRVVDAAITDALEMLSYEIASANKLFIGSYTVEKMIVADSREEEAARMAPPFHIDPEVTIKKSYASGILQALNAFAAMAAGGPEKIKAGRIDPEVAQMLSAKYNADALVLAIGVSRRIPGEADIDGALTSSRLYRLRMSMLCIGVFHGFDGKLLWYGQRTFESGPLNAVFKSSAKQLLSDFPRKGEGPYFSTAR